MKWELPVSTLTTDGISQWMAENTTYDFHRPIGRQTKGEYSFSLSGTLSFSTWSRASAAEQKFQLGSGRDNFIFFSESATSQDIGVGSKLYRATAKSAIITSIDRFCSLKMAEGSDAHGFIIRRELIAKSIAAVFERPMPQGFEFSPEIDGEAAATQKILSLGRFFTNSICPQSDLVASPIALASFVETLSLLIVQNFQHSLSGQSLRLVNIAPCQVRKARDFAVANAHLPITVSDMADAAGVSVRALQYNFRHFLDVSPSLFLRDIRLDSAHKEIQLSPPTVTIAEIAKRWGFSHMGRFSEVYKRRFGASPSSELSKQRNG